MKILITGGAGFIGTHLHNLLKKTHKVQIIDAVLGDRVQDLTELDLFGVDVIFHLAATARVGVSLLDPERVIENNVTSTLRLLEHCRHFPKTKLIFISSSSVRFANPLTNPYAMSKLMCEQLIALHRESYKLTATSVRLFNVYGPGEADYGEFTTLLKQCKKGYHSGQGFYITGDGSAVRDFTHVSDVVAGLALLLKEQNLLELYELGAGTACVSVKDIVYLFQEGTNLPIEIRPARPADPALTCADKNFALPGWEPQIKVLDYIRQWKAEGCPDD